MIAARFHGNRDIRVEQIGEPGLGRDGLHCVAALLHGRRQAILVAFGIVHDLAKERNDVGGRSLRRLRRCR